MAQMTTTNNDLINPSFHFHQTTFGQNIRLENNTTKAVRHTSFDHGILINILFFFYFIVFFLLGITFTEKPININERIHLKIVEVDETRQWCGSLAIGNRKKTKEKMKEFNLIFLGFTQVDPNTIRQEDLPKSALPNLNLTNKFSYVKRLYETLTKQLCIIFYYNPE